MLYAPLNSLSGYINQFASGFNALRRLFEIMDTPPEVKEKENPVADEVSEEKAALDTPVDAPVVEEASTEE